MVKPVVKIVVKPAVKIAALRPKCGQARAGLEAAEARDSQKTRTRRESQNQWSNQRSNQWSNLRPKCGQARAGLEAAEAREDFEEAARRHDAAVDAQRRAVRRVK